MNFFKMAPCHLELPPQNAGTGIYKPELVLKCLAETLKFYEIGFELEPKPDWNLED